MSDTHLQGFRFIVWTCRGAEGWTAEEVTTFQAAVELWHARQADGNPCIVTERVPLLVRDGRDYRRDDAAVL